MDSDQLRAAKTGDPAALDIVFQWFTDELFGFFRRRVSWDTAADLVQQTSVEVLKKFAEAPEDPVEFGRWMRGYGRNIELRWRHKVGRYGEVLAEYEDQPSSPVVVRGFESEFGDQEARELVNSAIEKLPSPYRSTLRLFNQQHDNRAIAARLGVAEGTVRWRLMVAREKLEGLIQDARVTRTPFRSVEVAS